MMLNEEGEEVGRDLRSFRVVGRSFVVGLKIKNGLEIGTGRPFY
jgi:hypothetical protein